ncbi:MAG: succinyldiaminopimelate transaminase [Gammaproteobacteria bacterium]|nr:succinyldiaminopimelate transaminase [Gammaproteobacteria bacterium]MCP5135547.1 succinyldiaminopimelate transaminase [Gammaproteobacteria bacterium]
MNPDLDRLHDYPFQKLAKLFAGTSPPTDRSDIKLSIGEPKHPAPAFVRTALIDALDGLGNYPLTKGSVVLRNAIAAWLKTRFRLDVIDAEREVLPVTGTREALFAFAQAVIDRRSDPLVAMPNPFYQIYEGAALLAGAEPHYLNTTADHGFQPDFDAVPASVWERCQLLYLCSPGNPTGAVLSAETLGRVIELADRHDFLIASDECYSELYPIDAEPPVGILEVCAAQGRHDYRRCIAFHSLSKRSNLPGMRSGFVAGDAEVLERFLLYRTYHGCAMAPPHQAASTAAWQDEAHVAENRALYQAKFDAVLTILSGHLDVVRPDAGFYLWARTPGSDLDFARGLYDAEHVTVLPGSYLSREADGINPGSGYVRMALVAPLAECVDAARRIRRYIESL